MVPVMALGGGCIVADQLECRHREPRESVVPIAPGVRRVEVRALAGELVVRGQTGGGAPGGEIRVQGTACARRRRDLPSIELGTRVREDRVVVEAVVPRAAGRRGARLDLSIEVPSDVELLVSDSSGDIAIEGVAAVDLEDSSGDVRLDRVAGNVSVDDNSGDVEVWDIGGELRIEDRSGDIEVHGAAAVTVVSDGSGDIEIEDVTGDVTILEDGSGDVDAVAIGGDLRIEDKGSGDVDHADVGGDVVIR